MSITRLLKEAREAWRAMRDVDPYEYLYDDEEQWNAVSTSNETTCEFIQNEEALREIRESCRHLAMTNEFAINGHENRISFIVGSGHAYRVESRPGCDLPADTLRRMQAWLDDFLLESRWRQRQQEIVRRKDRDGEAFIRFFTDGEGHTYVRCVEPDQVRSPVSSANDSSTRTAFHDRLGIRTAAGDVENVLGYWIDEDLVSAGEIQHRKANVDFNVLRGVPLFYPVRKNLRRAEKLLRNMSIVAEIQSAIAIIRKHNGVSRSGIESYAAANADRAYPSASGQPAYFRNYSPGTILDTSGGVEYQFPAATVDAARYVTILQAELRAIASRLVMPEFMLTSDAGNANYASTMVAEGPAVRMFQRLQHDLLREDIHVMRQVMHNAARAGVFQPEDVLCSFVRITPPGLSVRDRLRETQADRILVEMGAMSVQTMAQRHGLDVPAT